MDCTICFDKIENIPVSKWICNHNTFHDDCISKWTNGCPLCRCQKMKITEKIYTNPHFDIRYFLTFATKIEYDISQYREVWKRTQEKECIDNLHKITFHNQYSVIGICHDCSIVHGFNYIK